ncbi:MAG TPA: hypothetical protein VKX25_18245 [Bryobacteraceae bacterium]|nr:hypothetical protein [Bryobacteraceae bacterium]
MRAVRQSLFARLILIALIALLCGALLFCAGPPAVPAAFFTLILLLTAIPGCALPSAQLIRPDPYSRRAPARAPPAHS